MVTTTHKIKSNGSVLSIALEPNDVTFHIVNYKTNLDDGKLVKEKEAEIRMTRDEYNELVNEMFRCM